MKAKYLLFSLLFLMLGTTAWADKYYMPKSYKNQNKVNPRLTLENAVGKRFMIYNTAIDAGIDEAGKPIFGIDKTGFLRNGGAEFAHDKSKERDLFIYNESFVYTLEKHTDDTGTWYAIKSLSTGTYVDCNGKTTHKNAADAKLNIYNWSEAKNLGITTGTSMECWEYNIVENSMIEHQSVVFVIGKYAQGGGTYWSGGTTSFGTDERSGHPYVFYEALEFTDESQSAVKADKPFLQDLHAYSRCDMYSSQRAYGLVHVHSDADKDHITVPGIQEPVHGIHLCDGDILTSVEIEARKSLQFLFNNGEAPSAVHIYLQRNADKTNVPTAINVEVSNDGNVWKTVATSLEVKLNPHCATAAIGFGVDNKGVALTYSYLRISDANGKAMSLSEVYIFPHGNDGVLHTLNEYLATIAALDNEIHTKASAQRYADVIEEYNENYAAVKLLSGIPYAGNKYRIHADIFSHNEHEKLQIGVDGNSIKLGGDYFAAADKTIYEWYSERLSDGSLAFKNVKTGRYLALDMTTSVTPVGWNINTSLTQRTGVPLRNAGTNYYLAVSNGGESLGSSETIHTDFVFMPVDVTENEKKITFTANELVMRNTVLYFDVDGDGEDEQYTMPFSRVFRKKDGEDNPVRSLPTLKLLCPERHHYYTVVKVSGEAHGNSAIATLNGAGDLLTFNWSAIDNGDVLDIQLEIKKPFEITQNVTAEKPEPETFLYFIRNMRTSGLQQQVRPNRANIGIEGDGPVSVQGNKYDYAKFYSRTTAMHLVQDNVNASVLDATSLFYFTPTEDSGKGDYYSVKVNNATTVKKFATNGVWDENGGTWYVQPDNTGTYPGYNIGATKLNATNLPADAWCAEEGADAITFADPNNDGTAWDFVPVPVNTAKVMLMAFITKVADELTRKLKDIEQNQVAAGYDLTKIGYYKSVVGQLKSKGEKFSEDGNIYKLVQYAQNIHMLEHEIEYALIKLPLYTQLEEEGNMGPDDNFDNPQWYYIRNVASNNYAAYTSNDHAMNLEQYAEDKRLKNMFYLVGNKNSYAPVLDNDKGNDAEYRDVPGNDLIIDEYLKVHLHNFMAGRNTLVSKNLAVDSVKDCYPGYGMKEILRIKDGGLLGSENWSIEAEYELDGSSFNAYGSCLLSSQKDALADYFPNAFQVYFKDNRTIVLKINSQYDTETFIHTQEFFSKIKVVVTYSFGKLTIDIYNSAGQMESWEDYVQLNDIPALYSAFPKNKGINISRLVVKKTEKMNWKIHLPEAENDLWFIMPSSNLTNKGFSIVLNDAFDTNVGWTNANSIIDTAPGDEDNSSWQFERVIQFDNHIDELLEMYNLKDCVIYNKELAALMKLIAYNTALIKANTVGGDAEEALFNEVYYAILNYNGPMPDELKAPKPGSLYTIRPMVEEDTENALLVHVDENGTYTTKEVYIDDVVRDDKSYDSRAAWVFDGADGSKNTDLKAKNLHTQCYMTALGAEKSVVDEESDASITLAPLGACTTMFQVGNEYMNRTSSTGPVVYGKHSGFWGNAVTEYPADIATVFESVTGHNAVHCKSLYVNVDAEGAVTVTFTHKTGSDKLNMLGVTLVNGDGDIVASEYHYGKAGGSHFNNEYSLGTVAPGVYTLNLYVANLVHSNADYNDKVYNSGGEVSITGISQIAGAAKVINAGNDKTKWIIEEILEPEERVYYSTSTNQNGHSTLMLGFPAQIPTEVEAFYASSHHNMIDGRYLRMVSYDEAVLPAKTPVVLRNRDYANNSTTINDIKFYYREDAVEALNGNYLYGSLYRTLVKCASFDGTDVDGDGVGETDVNIYMLQTNKTDVKMYWVYENYTAEGEKTGPNDLGGYVLCKANKAYMVLPSDKAASISSFSFSFDAPTTEIEEVENVECDSKDVDTIYDLQGRRITEISHPGVYIVNGKKIIVK